MHETAGTTARLGAFQVSIARACVACNEHPTICEQLYYSVGRIVRTIAESDPKANTENHAIKEAIAAGEMIAKRSLDRLIEEQLVQLADRRGVIIDGLPRDVQQVRDFEEKVSAELI